LKLRVKDLERKFIFTPQENFSKKNIKKNEKNERIFFYFSREKIPYKSKIDQKKFSNLIF